MRAAEQKRVHAIRDSLKTGTSHRPCGIDLLLPLADQAPGFMFGAHSQVADAAEARNNQQADRREDHRRHCHLWRHQRPREIDDGRLRPVNPARILASNRGRDNPVMQ